ncbi:MAG: L-2-amino-thiazoline-4-carboxylic acid hydrolase [Candidatus Hermodarchaeota archaeon]
MTIYRSIYRYKYNPKVKLKINVLNVPRFNLRVLDDLLSQLTRDFPETVNTYVEHLSNRFEEQAIETYSMTPEGKFAVLQKFPTLIEKAINAHLCCLGYSKYTSEVLDEKIEVFVSDALKGGLMFRYLMAIALTSIMSREKAIQYFQKFIDDFTRRNLHERVEDLGSELKSRSKFFNTYHGHECVTKFIEKGRLVRKITKCMYHEVMKEVNDPDFSYALCCHGDFEETKQINEHFVLTRKKTLIQNHEMCDFCIHDTRIIEQITHPSPEFWENLR